MFSYLKIETCVQKGREIERLKAAIAEVVQENLEIKKKIGERLRRRGQI